jgi:hypothetical protein
MQTYKLKAMSKVYAVYQELSALRLKTLRAVRGAGASASAPQQKAKLQAPEQFVLPPPNAAATDANSLHVQFETDSVWAHSLVRSLLCFVCVCHLPLMT